MPWEEEMAVVAVVVKTKMNNNKTNMRSVTS